MQVFHIQKNLANYDFSLIHYLGYYLLKVVILYISLHNLVAVDELVLVA